MTVLCPCGERPIKARGLCKRDYVRARRAGLFLDVPTCSVDGCDQATEARGLCHRHHVSWWKAQKKNQPKD